MAAAKKYSVERIIAKLREHEKLQGQGLTIPQACKWIGILDQTFYRWRLKYGAWAQFLGRNKASCSARRVVGAGVLMKPSAHVAIYVANRRKNAANLDGGSGRVSTFELKPIVSDISARDVSEFGTVRPRVQIPRPRLFCIQNRRFQWSAGVSGTQLDHNFLRIDKTEAM